MMTLSKRIRDLRYNKGWGPDDLASRAQISRTALYHLESGRTGRPHAGTLRRIARALGVSPEDLLREDGAAPAAAAGGEDRPAAAPLAPERVQELFGKFLTLLASPMAEGVAQIIEESYRLLPIPTPPRGEEAPAEPDPPKRSRGPRPPKSRLN